MKVDLGTRTAETVTVYFAKAQKDIIRQTLPQKARTLGEALRDYEETLRTVGAFTYSDNIASIKVLEKNGFSLMEEFSEDGRWSKYFR